MFVSSLSWVTVDGKQPSDHSTSHGSRLWTPFSDAFLRSLVSLASAVYISEYETSVCAFYLHLFSSGYLSESIWISCNPVVLY